VEEQVRRRQAELEEARAAVRSGEAAAQQGEEELAAWRRSSPFRPDEHGELRPPRGATPAEAAEWNRKRAEFQQREAVLHALSIQRRAICESLRARVRECEQRLEQFRALLPDGEGER
jgi:hypothetical protein